MKYLYLIKGSLVFLVAEAKSRKRHLIYSDRKDLVVKLMIDVVDVSVKLDCMMMGFNSRDKGA